MRLGGDARYLAQANSVEELTELLTWAERINIPNVIIGSGSNIIWQDGGFEGVVIVNKIKGFSIRQIGGTDATLFTLGAGENWDESVRKTVEMGYSGIEHLSLIPGTCGAAPVQNIGAYGREVKDVLVSVRAYDQQTKQFVTLTNEQCEFGYRTSCFKKSAKGRYAIVGVTVKLQKTNPSPPFYASLQAYLDEYHLTEFTPLVIRNAVVAIRTSKLPDPKDVANNGSFFGNPFVTSEQAKTVLATNPQAPNWPNKDGTVKLSAAWLVEQAGFTKGYKDEATGMALWKDQALVLVNERAKSTSDLIIFKQKIINSVKTKFGITLEQEPELI